jgi:hypothetical protein
MSEDTKTPEEEKPLDIDGFRYFYSRAYLLPIDKELFGLYRSMIAEEVATGKREKTGKPVGPIKILRKKLPSDKEEAVRVRTVHPKTGESLELVEWEG